MKPQTRPGPIPDGSTRADGGLERAGFACRRNTFRTPYIGSEARVGGCAWPGDSLSSDRNPQAGPCGGRKRDSGTGGGGASWPNCSGGEGIEKEAFIPCRLAVRGNARREAGEGDLRRRQVGQVKVSTGATPPMYR